LRKRGGEIQEKVQTRKREMANRKQVKALRFMLGKLSGSGKKEKREKNMNEKKKFQLGEEFQQIEKLNVPEWPT